MPLRPIDAIFVNPKEFYYVIYHGGMLHRLVRMKLDCASWERRIPYMGSEDDIILIRTQRIADPELQALLNTQSLPASLHGRSFRVFKKWWQVNGYQWIKDHQLTKDIAITSNADDGVSPKGSVGSSTDANITGNISGTEVIQPEHTSRVSNDMPPITPQKQTTSDAIIPLPQIDIKGPVDDDFFDTLLEQLNH